MRYGTLHFRNSNHLSEFAAKRNVTNFQQIILSIVGFDNITFK